MTDQLHLDLDVVMEYIEEAVADPTLHTAEREVVLELRQIPESVASFAQFEADFLRIDPSTLATIEEAERHLRSREDTLHTTGSRLRAIAGELRAIATELPTEQDELCLVARKLHAIADRVHAEWDVLHAEWCALRAREDDLHPKALIYHVFRELYMALCMHNERYGREVTALATDATLLIAAITRQVARRGFEAAAASAVAATVLWLITKLGEQAFCDFYAPYFSLYEA